jgi:hypothetical protein
MGKFTTADLRARAEKLYGHHQGDTVAMLSWAADVIDAAHVVIAEYREKEKSQAKTEAVK